LRNDTTLKTKSSLPSKSRLTVCTVSPILS
jgi:hypothetical protein